MKELLEQASALLGREVEVEKLKTGKFIVLWLNFSSNPPPVGDTEEEAVKNFITWFKENSNGRDARSGDNAVETDGTEDRATEVPS